MRGVYKSKDGYWISNYRGKYLGCFKNKREAEQIRTENEKIYGIPNDRKHLKNYDGWENENFKFIGDTEQPGNQKAVFLNKNTGKYETHFVDNVLRGRTTGKKRKDNIQGVSYDRFKSKWKASLFVEGKTVFQKKFSTKQEAIAARKAAEEKYLNNGGNN